MFDISLAFLCLLSLVSASVGGGRFTSDEERLLLLKPVVHLSFTYRELKGFVYNHLTFITNLFIYCATSMVKKLRHINDMLPQSIYIF